MKELFRKLTSRKLWAAIAGVAVGVATMFGVEADTISTIAGAAMTLGSVVAYIIAEGKIDAAHVATAAEAIETGVIAIETEPEETADESAELEDGNVC